MSKVTFDVVRTWIREYEAAVGTRPSRIALMHDQTIDLARDMHARWDQIGLCLDSATSNEKPPISSIMDTIAHSHLNIGGTIVERQHFVH